MHFLYTTHSTIGNFKNNGIDHLKEFHLRHIIYYDFISNLNQFIKWLLLVRSECCCFKIIVFNFHSGKQNKIAAHFYLLILFGYRLIWTFGMTWFWHWVWSIYSIESKSYMHAIHVWVCIYILHNIIKYPIQSSWVLKEIQTNSVQ